MIKWALGQLVKPIAGAVGTWQERKAQARRIEGELEDKRLELKRAKIDARIAKFNTKLRASSDYDLQVLKNRQTTWLDEFLGVIIAGITVLAFIPYTQPYVQAGWAAIASAPFWFSFAWITLIVSTLGGMMVLRILIGREGGRSVARNETRAIETSAAPSPGTTPQTPTEAGEKKRSDTTTPRGLP